jgi:aminoglycoside 3-N-acetyltransferase
MPGKGGITRLVAPLRYRLGRLRKRVRTFVARYRYPLDGPLIESALADLMEQPYDVLMVHSSLSACGHVVGGAATAIRAIERQARTLVMPTHTYCYAPPEGGPPPVYDATQTASRVGIITDSFWRQPDTLRSIHPSHSLAARGPRAEEFTRDHERCATPCGRGTPYDRLVRADAAALMFGATMFSYTFFHTAEDAAGAPYAYDPEPCSLVYMAADGSLVTISSLKQSMDERTFRAMDRPLEEAGLLRRRTLGQGQLLFLPSTAAVHEFLLRKFADEPYYLAAHPRGRVVP